MNSGYLPRKKEVRVMELEDQVESLQRRVRELEEEKLYLEQMLDEWEEQVEHDQAED